MGKNVVFAALGAAALVGALVWAIVADRSPEATPDTVKAETEAATPSPAPIESPEASTEAEIITQALPRFDLVRTEADGQTLVAGQALPASLIEVLVDEGPQANSETQSDGNFVTFLDLGQSSEPVVLRLRMTHNGQVTLSEDEVIVVLAVPTPDVPQDRAPDLLASIAPDTAPMTEARADGVPQGNRSPEQIVAAQPDSNAARVPVPSTSQAPDAPAGNASQSQPAAPGTAPTAPQPGAGVTALAASPAIQETPSVLLSTPQGIEVLQTAPLAPGAVALDAISYDAEGEVLLSGRGAGAAFVRIYLNNQPVSTSRIKEDGRWRLVLPDVETGTYTLRVDQVDEGGAVTARVESPFLRESAEVLQAAAAGAAPIRRITVQPGHTLWAISRDRYGDGLEYLRVFKANRDRIRDPDLIYPGQIFDLPEQPEE